MKQRKKDNGSGNDNWSTPDYILKDIKKEFGSFFDPCPLNHNISKWDGLKIPWRKVNFINPPYNNKDKVAFIKKAYKESLKGKTCVLLIPVTTDIPIFHELILPYGEIRFIQKRVKFKGYNSKGKYVENKSGQSGSMFVIFKPGSKSAVTRIDADLMKEVRAFCEKKFISEQQFIKLAVDKYIENCEEADKFFNIPPKILQNKLNPKLIKEQV